jgi:hypothetical protein
MAGKHKSIKREIPFGGQGDFPAFSPFPLETPDKTLWRDSSFSCRKILQKKLKKPSENVQFFRETGHLRGDVRISKHQQNRQEAPMDTGRERIPHDHIFKELIETFFEEFVELFLPEQAAEIDFSRVAFLKQEHFTDVSGGSDRRMDLVAKVGLKCGAEEFVLVHHEFEASQTPGGIGKFSGRMFRYFCQLHLRHGLPVVPIALFSDDAKWRVMPEPVHEIGLAGRTYCRFAYHLIKLKNLDYRDFLGSGNPVALALMAKMGYDKKDKVRLKAEFLRMILRMRIDPARKTLLADFVERYTELDPDEMREYVRLTGKSRKYAEVAKMITVYEKMGIEKGRIEGKAEGKAEGEARGKAEGKAESLLRILAHRFGSVSVADERLIRATTDCALLDQAIDAALDAKTLKEAVSAVRRK